MGFLNPNYPLSGERGGVVQLGRDSTATTLVQIKLVGLSNTLTNWRVPLV